MFPLSTAKPYKCEQTFSFIIVFLVSSVYLANGKHQQSFHIISFTSPPTAQSVLNKINSLLTLHYTLPIIS